MGRCCTAVLFFLHSCTSTQEGMRYKSPQVKAPPLSSRRMMPPTPLQNSNDTFEQEQELLGAEDQMWSAKERTVKVEVEELQDCWVQKMLMLI